MQWTFPRILALLFAIALLASACGTDDDTDVADADTDDVVEDFEPEFVDGVLQPLPDGFPDGPLTLFNVFDAGATDGIYARAMQAALQEVSPVGVRVEDVPTGPMIQFAGLDVIEERGGTDGSWLMVSAMTGAAMKLHTEPVTAELGYTEDDINPLIATETVPFVLVSRADAPWSNYEEMVEWAQDNPGELRYISWIVGSQLDIAMERLMALEDFDANKIPLSELPETVNTVAAGQGDVTMTLPGLARPQWEEGNLEVLLTVGDDVSPDPWPDVPTDRDRGFEEPWSSVRGFWLHPDVPEQRREWLFELVKAATEQDPYQQRLADEPGARAVEFGHEESLRIVRDTLEASEPIISDLGLLFEDE